MKTHLINWAERLRSSQWVMPLLLSTGALGLAQFALRIDLWNLQSGRDLPWPVYAGNAEGARQLLGTLAGSMVSLTTITFSITMIVLTLAANQFGPRILRNFLRDRFNQGVLGVFVATFLYCVVVLGQLPGDGEGDNVPRLAVTMAVAATIGCLIALLGFVHHTARSIQTSHVVQTAAAQLSKNLDTLYPATAKLQSRTTPPAEPPALIEPVLKIRATTSGYLQAVDNDGVVAWAAERKTVVEIFVRPGAFITAGDCLVAIGACEQTADEDQIHETVRGWFILGAERTGEQDTHYGFRQLVEIAVRALSPGINDPFTAINAIDQLGSALALLAEREPRSAFSNDEDGELRLISPNEDFVAIARATFDPLRFYGREHPLVIEQLACLQDTLSTRLKRDADLAWLRASRQQLRDVIGDLPDETDRKRLSALLN